MPDVSQPPVEQVADGGDPCPCTEDEEVFVRPGAAGMKEAIDKFFHGLEGQERSLRALSKCTDSLQLCLCQLQRKADK